MYKILKSQFIIYMLTPFCHFIHALVQKKIKTLRKKKIKKEKDEQVGVSNFTRRSHIQSSQLLHGGGCVLLP